MNASAYARSLRIAGVVVFCLGTIAALLIDRTGRDPQLAPPSADGDWRDSTLSSSDSKASARNIELYGGKLELLMVSWMEKVRQPRSLALLTASASAAVALACFLAARTLPPRG
jgi:hypothetical protein